MNQNLPSFKSRIVNNEEFRLAQYAIHNSSLDQQDIELFNRSLIAIKNDNKNDIIEVKNHQNTDRYQVYVNGEKKEDRAINMSKGNAVIRAIIRYATNNKVLPSVDKQRNLIDELEAKLKELKDAYHVNIVNKTNELCEQIKISQ